MPSIASPTLHLHKAFPGGEVIDGPKVAIGPDVHFGIESGLCSSTSRSARTRPRALTDPRRVGSLMQSSHSQTWLHTSVMRQERTSWLATLEFQASLAWTHGMPEPTGPRRGTAKSRPRRRLPDRGSHYRSPNRRRRQRSSCLALRSAAQILDRIGISPVAVIRPGCHLSRWLPANITEPS